MHIAVAYFKPGIKHINVDIDGKSRTIAYQFPYTVFIQVSQLGTTSGYAYFTKSKPTEKSILYEMEFPNARSNGGLCVGDVHLMDPEVTRPKQVVERMEHVLFGAVYNDDYKDYYLPFKHHFQNYPEEVMSRDPASWKLSGGKKVTLGEKLMNFQK